MSQNFSSAGSTRPLNIGNVVTAGLRLYRSHFKQYLGLAGKACLWSLVPVYGWAKLHTINAVISRLAFAELVNQPETVKAAQEQVRPHLWSFLGAQILVGVLLLVVQFGLSLVQSLILNLLGFVAGQSSSLYVVLTLIVNLASIAAYIWVYSRLLIPELPLAMESNMDASKAVSRSWDLTQSYVLKLQGVVLVTSLLTLPLLSLAMIPLMVAFFTMIALLTTSASSAASLGTLFGSFALGIILVILASIVISPLWQAVKAVVYYDLKSRREGLGLKLRDRPSL